MFLTLGRKAVRSSEDVRMHTCYLNLSAALRNRVRVCVYVCVGISQCLCACWGNYLDGSLVSISEQHGCFLFKFKFQMSDLRCVGRTGLPPSSSGRAVSSTSQTSCGSCSWGCPRWGSTWAPRPCRTSSAPGNSSRCRATEMEPHSARALKPHSEGAGKPHSKRTLKLHSKRTLKQSS